MQRLVLSHAIRHRGSPPVYLYSSRVQKLSFWSSKKTVPPYEPAIAAETMLQDTAPISHHPSLPATITDNMNASCEPAALRDAGLNIESSGTFVEPVTMVFQVPVSEMASAGLGAWTPVGAIQNLAEFVHAGLGLPWWASVIGLTAMLKLSLFGLSVKQTRLAAAMHNHKPEMEKLTANFNRLKLAGDLQGSRTAHLEYRRYVNEHHCSPTRMFLYSFLPAPIYICSFLALRDMASAGLPSLIDGGLFWFTNLALPDPFYILPVFSAVGIVLNYHAARFMNNTQGNGFTAFIYTMAAVSVPFTASLPSLTLVYFSTLNFFNAAQNFLWRFGWLRRVFRIPERVVRPFDPSRPGFMESVRETYKALQEQRAQAANELLKSKSLLKGPVEVVSRATRKH